MMIVTLSTLLSDCHQEDALPSIISVGRWEYALSLLLQMLQLSVEVEQNCSGPDSPQVEEAVIERPMAMLPVDGT